MARTLLTRAQTAAMFGVSTREINRWRKDDGLPYSTVLFRTTKYYPRGAVKRWAKEHDKRVHPIIDPKDVYAGLKPLFPDEPPTDPFIPSTLKCKGCGQRLLVHRLGDHWKCPSGCSIRKVGTARWEPEPGV